MSFPRPLNSAEAPRFLAKFVPRRRKTGPPENICQTLRFSPEVLLKFLNYFGSIIETKNISLLVGKINRQSPSSVTL